MDLLRALKDLGLTGTVRERLTSSDLRFLDGPAILHVRAHDWSQTYDHWFVYLGFEGHVVLVADGVAGLRRIPVADLSRLWSGGAIVVTRGDYSGKRVLFFRVIELSGYALAIAASLALMRVFLCSVLQLRSGAPFVQAMMILIAAAVVGLMLHFIAPTGFLRSPQSARVVEEWNTSAFLKTVTVSELRSILDRKENPGIVDARSQVQFDAGHIPGAQLWSPFDVLDDRVPAFVGRLDPRRSIIVYCSNPKCPAANIVAQRLRRLGFTDVAVFTGGWEEWEASSK